MTGSSTSLPSVDSDRHTELPRDAPDRWDVAICGGGLAGMCLALQLRRRMPDLQVLVLERDGRDPPDGCFKVGESCVEGATHWFCETLGLKDYLFTHHIKKLGLRFFGSGAGGGATPFHHRFEIGAHDFPPVDSIQLDRGRFERDLRGVVSQAGATLVLGAKVGRMTVGQGGEDHRFEVTLAGDSTARQLRTRWLIDASGRARRLAKHLDLRRDSPHRASACWFRVEGECDVSDIVAPTETEWRSRTIPRRWHSTNHLLGTGYWVWLIPLAGGRTSIGIVADDRLHPLEERRNHDLARAWLRRHEPGLAQLLANTPSADFRVMRDFAHSITRAFSVDRWACVGEAAAFYDPLYSMGSDLIAWACSSVTTLIALDRQQALDPATVDYYDQAFRECVDYATGWTCDMYPVFGHDGIMLRKLLWDALAYFMAPVRILLHDFLANPQAIERYNRIMQPAYALDRQMQAFFRTWAEASESYPAPPGVYGPEKCPDLAPLAAIRPTFASGLRFLGALPGFIETMHDLAAAFGAQAERDCGIANPFGPAPASLVAQVDAYAGTPTRPRPASPAAPAAPAAPGREQVHR